MDLTADRRRYEADRAKDLALSKTNGIDACRHTHTTRPYFPAAAALRCREGRLPHRDRSLRNRTEHQAKHFFYAAGWKKFEPLWDYTIRAKRLAMMTPLLESVLSKVTAVTSTPMQTIKCGTMKTTCLTVPSVTGPRREGWARPPTGDVEST